jgi:ABC-type polysaccharide/polyol phosphate export permease
MEMEVAMLPTPRLQVKRRATSARSGATRTVTRGGLGAHLFLLRQLAGRDFQGRYAGSMLGFAWSFVQPVWQLLLFSYVFGLVLRVPLTGEGTARFWVFLFAGLLPWLAVQEGALRGATAVTDNANLVTKHHLRSEVLVMGVVAGALLHQAVAAAVFVVVLALNGELSVGSLPWLLLALPLQVTLTSGLALLAAACHVFVRDTAQVLGMAMNAWFYLTPIVYPVELVPDAVRGLAYANPLTGVVGLYRSGLFGAPLPSPSTVMVSAAAGMTVLAIGSVVFGRLRADFADAL